ncbi:MAG: type II secretion system protein [Chloroflexota bacterium]|nr:type II secretion system protein [Chloroflexota bacterium]
MMVSGQRGIALAEVLIATAITGLLAGVVSTSIYQFVTVTERSSQRMTALHEVQNAASWVVLDGQMASTAVGGNQLLLTLPDGSSITYVLAGAGPRYELQRTAGASTIAVARNITAVDFSLDGRLVTMTITSSPESRWNITEERIYQVHLRPTG